MNAIEGQLKTRFREIWDEKYNTNTKGYDYEEILQRFFADYLDGGFNFLIRMGVLDYELKVNEIFKATENEFDILAVYRNSVPKLVHHRMVPYDSVAFIAEVKQTLKLPDLEKDLAKLDKLNELPVANNRSGIFAERRIFRGFRVNKPLKMLFYYKKEAKDEEIFKMLEGAHAKSWDICVVLEEEVVFLNSTLPYVRDQWKDAHFVRDFKYPLLKAMFFACAFIEGDFIDSWVVFWNLFRSSLRKPETAPINK